MNNDDLRLTSYQWRNIFLSIFPNWKMLIHNNKSLNLCFQKDNWKENLRLFIHYFGNNDNALYQNIHDILLQLNDIKKNKCIISDIALVRLPTSLNKLEHLHSLALDELDIYEVPKDIEILKNNLFHLSINKCYAIKEIPSWIGNLTNLKTLMISRCRILTVPESIVNINYLETLHLGYNQLNYLPTSILFMTSLKRLNLDCNENLSIEWQESMFPNGNFLSIMNTIVINTLPTSFWIRLFQLNISDCNITYLPDNINSISNLEYLNISKNKLTILPEGCIFFINLHYFNISNNLFINRPQILLNMKWVKFLIE